MMHGRRELLRALDAWRQGRADAPVVCKWTAQPAPQSLGPGDGGYAAAAGPESAGARDAAAAANVKGYPVVASTGDVDRHGDIVMPDGWQLDAYRANPVVLWAHDYRQPAIGRAPAVWRAGRALLASIEFAPTDFGRTVAGLYRDGYQRGVSVGFRPIRFEERRDGRNGALLGIRFLEQELLEISAVPVPANGNALGSAIIPAINSSINSSINPAINPAIAQGDRELGAAAASVVALLRGLRG